MKAPVIQRASSVARNATTSAMSAGSPTRPKADSFPIASRASGMSKTSLPLLTMPGATLLTVMPRGPRCRAKCRPIISTAALVIAYATSCGFATRVSPDEMLMMRPPSGMSVSARCTMKNGALALTATSRSKSSGVTSVGATPPMIPALFTRMSSSTLAACSFSSVCRASNNVSTSPGTPSSARTGNAWPPASVIDATVCRAASALLE